MNLKLLSMTAAALFALQACGSGSASSSNNDEPASSSVSSITSSKVGTELYQAQTIFSTPADGSAFAYMYVKLDKDPGEEVTITVERSSGDTDQGIYPFMSSPQFSGGHFNASSHDLTFNSSNWSDYQVVAFGTFDDTEDVEWADFELSSDHPDFTSKTVTTAPAVAADTTVTGTITRGPFAAAVVAFDEEVDDITFELSWKKVGTGSSARYYGTYKDNDTLNQLSSDDAHAADAIGNEAREEYTYPAYGFWKDDDLHFVIVKNLLTPRATSEVNLLLLVADDESFTDGTGYVTATGASYTTVGSYDISFLSSASAGGHLMNIFPVVTETPEFPVYSLELQTQTYSPGAVSSANGQWELTADGSDDYLFTGTTEDSSGDPAGTVHGFAFGSISDVNLPNVLGVLEDGGNTYIFGLPFYAQPDPESFPFGALGGRMVDVSDGTTDRIFLFLSLTGTM